MTCGGMNVGARSLTTISVDYRNDDVKYVFDGDRHTDQRNETLQTTVEIPWETPRTAVRDRYGLRGQKLRGKQTVPAPIAHSARTTVVVPAGLSGVSKADALARWDAEVDRYIGMLVPVDVVACDRCDGHGHLLATVTEV